MNRRFAAACAAAGLEGRRTSHGVPYRSISHFSIETAGVNDWDAELKIYVSGNQTPAFASGYPRAIK